MRRLRPRDELRGDPRVRDLTVWTPGETIVIQEVWEGMLWAARPVIVVEDREGFLAVWCPKGTRRKVPTTPPTRPTEETRGERLATCLARRDWVLVDHEWDVSTLMLTEDGAMHSVWVSFFDNGDHWGWYVNLQLPIRRTQDAVQTMDLALDVLIAPDRTSWRWKDEDEFQMAIDRNLIDWPRESGPRRPTSFAAPGQTSPRSATRGLVGDPTPHGASRASPKAGIV
jgi:hypothetical protein